MVQIQLKISKASFPNSRPPSHACEGKPKSKAFALQRIINWHLIGCDGLDHIPKYWEEYPAITSPLDAMPISGYLGIIIVDHITL